MLPNVGDLDFLLFKLFATDAGYGKIFKDIQVSNYAAKLLEADFQNLQPFGQTGWCMINLQSIV